MLVDEVDLVIPLVLSPMIGLPALVLLEMLVLLDWRTWLTTTALLLLLLLSLKEPNLDFFLVELVGEDVCLFVWRIVSARCSSACFPGSTDFLNDSRIFFSVDDLPPPPAAPVATERCASSSKERIKKKKKIFFFERRH